MRSSKFYPIDWGLYGATISTTSLDLEKRLETAVLHHLRRFYSRVYYWRGQNEIDFVVIKDGYIIPYQVSWDGPKLKSDKALKEFSKTHRKVSDLVFISQKNAETFLQTPLER